MKKVLVLVMALLTVGVMQAQKRPVTNAQAIHFLNKTNKIIRQTHQKVKIHKIYTGGVAAAKKYQRQAIQEFKTGHNRKAVNDSYLARRLAFRAYKANSNKPIPAQWKLGPNERRIVTIKVTPKRLNTILVKEFVQKEKQAGFTVDDVSDVEE